MKGSKGSWKEFLNFYDKKLGACLSDPARRSTDSLAAFLKTFSQEDDLKFFGKVMQCHSNREIVEQLRKNSPDTESPEQRLVRSTLEHPQYSIDFSFPSHEEEWLVTKPSKKIKKMRSAAMLAVDCEMVLCEDATEALVRVCVVDRNLQVKLNEHVNPNKAVADYRTDITGVTAKDLNGSTCSLADIQKSMKKLLLHGTILVGHSLNNDLQALKIDHARVIDTSLIFKYGDEPNYKRPSLNNLCKSVLGYEVRKKGVPHNCLDDACAAMKLVLAKIERGLDHPIPLVNEGVPETEVAKLLIHRIPINVPSEELHKIIPGDFTIEIKSNKKPRGEKYYSAFAIFRNLQEASQAFEEVKGNQENDSYGRPQKFLSFEVSTGVINIYVRKMEHDDPISQVLSRKRTVQVEEETSSESKKLKTEQVNGEPKETMAGSNECDGHLEEIKRLKKELKQRDRRITNLNKILTALARKQGL
ncbi:small RNA degrading nuclease 1-like isoform X2 [Cornus florida]|nr:small RNA degrading nuclease 1-like isoform X2 [Cornus florida]